MNKTTNNKKLVKKKKKKKKKNKFKEIKSSYKNNLFLNNLNNFFLFFKTLKLS
jgi:hypothetical protein